MPRVNGSTPTASSGGPLGTEQRRPGDRASRRREQRGQTTWIIPLLIAVVVVNLAQFQEIEGSLTPTWQALTRADDGDLAAVAAERDESGVVELQFSLALALREHASGRGLVVSDDTPLQGVLSLELLTGLGQVACVKQRPLDKTSLAEAIPTGYPATARSVITAGEEPFALLLDDPVGPWLVLLDAREQRGGIVIVDAGLLPEGERPEPTC